MNSCEPSPGISTSERLSRSLEQILVEWERRVRAEVASSEGQLSSAILDEIKSFLMRLTGYLSMDTGTGQQEVTDKGQVAAKTDALKHGAARADLGQYALDEVIYEYHILREVLFAALEEEKPLTQLERDITISCIEQAVNDAASEYVKTVRHQQEIFLLGMIHDLRSPTNRASLALQQILRSDACNIDIIKERVALAYDNIKSVDDLATDLLEASKAHATGNISSLEFSDLNLIPLISEIAREINENLGYERINTVLPSESEITGKWSEKGLRRTFENLIKNALKYGSSDAPVVLTVSSKEKEATVDVHNQGESIPVADHERIFEPFSRGTNDDRHSSWGIGLALAKGVIDAHRGTIEVQSDEGKGTSFIVTLPF